jgi:hypothetical protein
MSELPPIDFARYPIDRGRNATAHIIEAARRDLGSQQYCSLPGFFGEQAVAEAAAQALDRIDRANPSESLRNCYLHRQGDPALPDDHPRNILNPGRYRMIAADLFDPDAHIKRLYAWDPFRDFVAAIVEEPELFPSEDPLQPVNVICYGDGDQSAWHYDSTNAFTMTLMLQAAEAGGAFQLAPNTRSGPEDEDIPYMQAVLAGKDPRIAEVSRAPGELTIFRGRNSLHRVTQVTGDTLRLMAVFVYESEPGVIGDPEVNMTVYGRTGL